jgi:cytochrome c553
MSFQFRLLSSVPLLSACLLALGGVVTGSQDPAPPVQPEGQPPPEVRPRMREHFNHGAAIRDAVIRADLEGIREPAKWFAEQSQADLPASAQSNIRDMQRRAAELAAAADLTEAARGVARLAAACGACHTAVDATPTLIAALPRGEDDSLAGHMRKHNRAVDLLYRGLVVPSDDSWNRGADALTGDPVELELTRGAETQPEIQALARQIHALARQAGTATDSKSRSEIYGQMLATCSDCHEKLNVTVTQGVSR